jgi:glutathione S-transferase
VSGALYVMTSPPLGLAEWLFYGYAISRLLHFAAYLTGQIHDVRATLWTIGSLIIVFMTFAAIARTVGV